MTAPLRVLSIATLFPDAARPNFGLFVERSLRSLAAQPGIDLTVVAPVGLPPWPLSLPPRSDERRLGNAFVSTCRSRWVSYHYTKKNTYKNRTLQQQNKR